MSIYWHKLIIFFRLSTNFTILFVKVTANHWGWFEFRLCNADSLYAQGKDATQECLNQNLLKDVNGKTRHNIGSTIGMTNFRLVLPSGLSCNHCVFQVIFIKTL